jgi:hydrogenase maturation protease
MITGKIKKILKGRVAILGVGNILKKDDGFGSLLAKRLEGKLHNFRVFDMEDAPENMIGKVLKAGADTILIIDCVSFNAAPGIMELFDSNSLKASGMFFTHNISIASMADFIRSSCRTAVYMLGVQPDSVSLGEGLSEVLTKRLDDLEKVILGLDRGYVLHDTRQDN